jgi:hypothetical protein
LDDGHEKALEHEAKGQGDGSDYYQAHRTAHGTYAPVTPILPLYMTMVTAVFRGSCAGVSQTV